MMRAWRRAAGMAAAGVLALGASLAAAGQAQAAAPAISVAASTKLPLVTHDALVLYQEGAYASAKIHGTISGAGAGEVARLYAQPFPYKKAATAVATVTLKASKASYSFTVSPSLATHYRVELFKSKTATAPVAESGVQNVYVTLANVVTGLKTCGRPTCHETITLTTKTPSSALSTELAKRVYAYFGLSLSKSGVPKSPTTLTRNGGKASISKATRVSATQYKFTIKFTFTVGNDGYEWLWDECSKDAVTKDGIGLPGTHSCGASKIPASTLYLG
jgi:type V secretory pathway adhesin AidA